MKIEDDARRLAEHAEECNECRAALPLDRVTTLLNASTVTLDEARLSQRTLLRLREALREQAERAFQHRVMVAVLVSVIPLVAVVAYDILFFGFVLGLLSMVLPPALATILVVSYAAFVLLGFALTYAAIPILLARRQQPALPL
jgi:hypothetical protein